MPHSAAGRALIRAAVAACAALALLPAHAIYKWVDEKGVTHFSENPPPDGRMATKDRAEGHAAFVGRAAQGGLEAA